MSDFSKIPTRIVLLEIFDKLNMAIVQLQGKDIEKTDRLSGQYVKRIDVFKAVYNVKLETQKIIEEEI